MPRGPWIERSAKLFEAGEFPEKGVSITPEQLAGLAGAFQDPVPVLIEHSESPLELGYLTSVQVMGDELFGTVSFTPEAHVLVERSGARSLSLGLTPDLTRIREVSLVRNPRIESAQLFSGGPVFWGELGGTCVLEGEALAECAEKVFTERATAPADGVPAAQGNGGDGEDWRERYDALAKEQ